MARARSMAEPGALATSVLLHAGLIALGAVLLHRSLAGMPAPASTPGQASDLVDVAVASEGIELPRMSRHGVSGPSDPHAEPQPPLTGAALGGERTARPEHDEPGRGGSSEASEAALNLADSMDGLTLDRDPKNRLDRSQLHRLRTADDRRSWDDRRATPNPMELSFLASGKGTLALRRPPADRNPSRGVASGAVASNQGALLGGPDTEEGQGPEAEPGASTAGGARRVDALGIAAGSEGRDYRRSARVMLARPMVKRARAAVPSPFKGRPNDTLDSTQDVASAVASLVHASTAGGRKGTGIGGERGPGAPASGGERGAGSRSTAAGSGPGALLDVGADAGVLGYFRAIERKVEPLWRDAFPTWAIAEGRGGLAVVTLVIKKDGSLASLTLTRASGVPEFDRNVLEALRRAAPFGPLPAPLRPGPQPLRMTFDATNPAVGREGPGRGRRGGS